MFQHYIKTAFRNIRRDKVSSFINIFGLAAALASVILILLFVRHELGYDRTHAHADRIYRIIFQSKRAQTRTMATVSPPMGPALEREYPEVETAVRVRYTDQVLLSRDGQYYYEKGLIYADSGFLKVFNFPLQAGDPLQALNKPNTVIITPEMATKYFGNKNPIGETIILDNETPLTVTGVFAENPIQTHLKFNLVVSFQTFQVPPGYPVTLESWTWVSFHTYILLKEGTQVSQLEAKLPQFVAEKFSSDQTQSITLSLQSLKDIYFYSGHLMNTDANRVGNFAYVRGLSIVAFLILLVAAFNFMNITIARAVSRGREVGVRKVLGAMRGSLLRQFLDEAVLLVSISLLAAIIFIGVGKDYLLQWLEWEMPVQMTDFINLIPVFIGLAILAGGISGLYPAVILSRFKPTRVLKGEIKTGNAGIAIRKTLVIAQFVIMTSLAVISLGVKSQMDFIKNRDLGFDKEQILSLQLQTPDFLTYLERSKKVFTQNPNILSVTAGDIMDGDYGSVPITFPGADRQNLPAMHILGAHFDYFKTMGIDLVEGREFLEQFPNDTARGIILNEAAVKLLGWEEPIGKTLQIGEIKEGEVVGVAKDFHYHSLHDPILPLAIMVPETIMDHILVRIKPGDVTATLASLQADWKQIAPELPFEVSFVDEQVQQRYQVDQGFSKLIYLFSTLTVIIAALGLYGLLAVIVSFRVKEIGIRKVLGANISHLVALLSKEFFYLVLVATLVAFPLSWWAMDKWLADFAYRTEIQGWMFALSGIFALAIALFTVTFQAVRAAVANPVKSLRSE